MYEQALKLRDAGLSIIPTTKDKIPFFSLLPQIEENGKTKGTWTPFKERLATDEELHRWFKVGNALPAIVGGNVSGYYSGQLCQMDFDDHKQLGCVFDEWWELVRKEFDGYFCELLVIHKTPGNGYHVRWRVESPLILASTDIAARWVVDPKTGGIGEEVDTIIEVRAEGQYALCPPSPGYELIQGSLLEIPMISYESHQRLVTIAEMFHTAIQNPLPEPELQTKKSRKSDGLSPGDDFNERGDYEKILVKHGWMLVHSNGDKAYWKHPTTEHATSATWNCMPGLPNRFYCFSPNTPFTKKKPYHKFAIYAVLECDGDFTLAAKQLAEQGYGEQRKPQKRVNENNVEPLFNPIQFTDGWRAKELVRLHGEDMRWSAEKDAWYIWDGKRFQIEKRRQSELFAKNVTGSLVQKAQEAANNGDKNGYYDLIHEAGKADTAAKYRSMISLARSEPEIPVEIEWFDSDPMLLNCQNGIIDMGTGSLLNHDRSKLMTKIVETDYDESAKCPKWLDFLAMIMMDRGTLIDFLQRAVGYSLTGRIHEQVLLILQGGGNNGKSTFVEAVTRMLGDYALHSPANMIIETPYPEHPTAIASLMGQRFVMNAELEEGDILSEGLVKRLTGGDTLTARMMRQDFFQFKPTHKLWASANDMPTIKGASNGIWRRIRKIPFDFKFIDVNIREFEDVQDELAEERSGILAWAVEGCLDWKINGLGIPSEIARATDEFRQDSDTVQLFLDERTIQKEGADIGSNNLFLAYAGWCDQNRVEVLSQTKFSLRLKAKGLPKKRTGHGNVFQGLEFMHEDTEYL